MCVCRILPLGWREEAAVQFERGGQVVQGLLIVAFAEVELAQAGFDWTRRRGLQV